MEESSTGDKLEKLLEADVNRDEIAYAVDAKPVFVLHLGTACF